MGKPYEDHPVYQALKAILVGEVVVDLLLQQPGGEVEALRVGPAPGYGDRTLCISVTEGELVLYPDDVVCAHSLAAALSAWADWIKASDTPPHPRHGERRE